MATPRTEGSLCAGMGGAGWELGPTALPSKATAPRPKAEDREAPQRQAGPSRDCPKHFTDTNSFIAASYPEGPSYYWPIHSRGSEAGGCELACPSSWKGPGVVEPGSVTLESESIPCAPGMLVKCHANEGVLLGVSGGWGIENLLGP